MKDASPAILNTGDGIAASNQPENVARDRQSHRGRGSKRGIRSVAWALCTHRAEKLRPVKLGNGILKLGIPDHRSQIIGHGVAGGCMAVTNLEATVLSCGGCLLI